MKMGSYRLQDILNSVSIDDIGQYYKFAVDYGLVDLVIHPFDYADTLIRLGYEPFPPQERSHFISGKSLALPSITSYVYYLYMIDGFSGCYRGVVPYVTGALVYRHLSAYVENKCPFPKHLQESEPRLCVSFTDENVSHFIKTKSWKLLANLIAIHASYPFHVLAVRTMARFVTKEGIRPSVQESWIEELGKIKDFSEIFAGCQARVIREVAFAVISTGSFLALIKLVHFLQVSPYQADAIEGSVEYLGNSIATMYTNPLRNVADIMIINQTDIPLGNPPYTEHFDGCIDCIKRLRKDKKWKTSAGLRKRSYTGPMEDHGGRLVARDSVFGPTYLPRHKDDIPFFLRSYYSSVLDSSGETEGLMDRRRGSIALSGIKALLSDSSSMNMNSLPPSFYYGTSAFRI